MISLESLPLHRSIGFKNQQHLIISGHNRMWNFTATKPTQNLILRGVAIVENHVVISALLMWFHFEVDKLQLDPMSGCGGENPNAILFGWVIIREMRTGDFAVGGGDFVFAAAFFAIVAIFVEYKA